MVWIFYAVISALLSLNTNIRITNNTKEQAGAAVINLLPKLSAINPVSQPITTAPKEPMAIVIANMVLLFSPVSFVIHATSMG